MANENETKAAKHSRARTWFQAAWFVLTNAYARGYTSGKIYTGNTKTLCVPGLNCYSCPGALASCPVGALQAVLNKGSYKISLYVFGLLTMFGVLFGRLVCAWMCPFGLVQDLLHKIPLGPKKKNLPGHHYLRWLRFVVLAVMVIALPMLVVNAAGVGQPWFCEWICPSGTLLGGIPLVLTNESFRQAIGFRFAWKVSLLVIICLGSIWFYRPFCKYLCPLGAFYGLFNQVSTYRLEVDPDKCVKCRACQRACGMDIPTFETPNSIDCIRCGDCIKACPMGAIESTWGKVGQRVASRCFIDDEDVARAAEQAAEAGVEASTAPAAADQKATVAMGAIMLMGGLGSAVGATVGLFKDFNTRLNVDALYGAPPGSLILSVIKVAASCIVLLTGIYMLRNRNDSKRLQVVSERMRLAYCLYLIGVLIGIIGLALCLQMFMVYLDALIYSPYCLLVLPLLWILAAKMCRRYAGEATNFDRVVSNVLLVVTGILSVAMLAFGLVVAGAYMFGA